MAYKHCCVVDAQGYYKTLVLVTSEDGTFDDASIYLHTLDGGETLIDAKPPAEAYIKPRWDGSQWAEGATEEEIAAANAAKVQEFETASRDAAAPTLTERVEAVEDALLALALGGVTGA